MPYKTKICARCNHEYIPASSIQKVCSPCAKPYERERQNVYRQAHPITVTSNYARDKQRRRKSRDCGISESQWVELISIGCPICGQSFTSSPPQFDHDHRICDKQRHVCEKCFRGVICTTCNTGFIRAIEQRPSLRRLVSQVILDYIDRRLTSY